MPQHHPQPVIAHVLHRLYLAGAEVLAAALARQLRDRYRFIFLCLDEVGPLGHQLQNQGFAVIDLARKPGVDFNVARRIHQVVQSEKIDLLHAHQYTPFFYASLSRRFSKTPAILFTEHGRHYPDPRKFKRVIANQLLLRKHDRITAVGAWVKQALVDKEGLPDKRIQVIYNGIDPQQFQPVNQRLEERTAVRTELDLTDDQIIVAQVARFHPVKDHATALNAWALLQKQLSTTTSTTVTHEPAAAKSCSQAILLLAGDGELRPQLEKQVHELGIGNSVRFLGVRKDVHRLLAGVDVFLLSSLSEGISVTLLEAMGTALPIAATHVGGNPEVVQHPLTGLLSPRSDAPALASNLLTLIRDKSLREQMGAAGRARLLAQFTQADMHAHYAAIYDQMLR